MPGTKWQALCVLLLQGQFALAQELTLFEATQGQQGPEAPQQQSMQPLGPAANAGGFTLRSSSRFGDEYHSVLLDAAGNAIDVRWRSGQTVALPQHPGYAVVGVSGSELTLQQPDGVPCIPAEAAGVRCLDTGTALLSLATLSPLPGAVASDADAAAVMGPQPVTTAEGDIVSTDANGNAVFINPFSGAVMPPEELTPEQAQARAERAQARAQRLQQFQPERIPEDQVPPGMRLVRTPFGDRLVPIRE